MIEEPQGRWEFPKRRSRDLADLRALYPAGSVIWVKGRVDIDSPLHETSRARSMTIRAWHDEGRHGWWAETSRGWVSAETLYEMWHPGMTREGSEIRMDFIMDPKGGEHRD